ncbi:MAG: hypothetical protein AAGK01_09985, partial [Pseudomonadota bacterium]
DPMRNITETAERILDIWPYVDQLDRDELQIEQINDVIYVYRGDNGRYEHIVIGTSRYNALLVIVIDCENRLIFGHFLLDLNEEYGVSGGHLRQV